MFELLVILGLIVANGLFAGAEIAILTVRRTRLAELVEEEKAGAASLAALRQDPESFLATVQIGITVVGAAAAAFGGATLAGPLSKVFDVAGVPEKIADDVALGVVVIAVSFLSLILGELVPKSLAMRFAEGYALAISRPLSVLARLSRPVIRLLTACSNIVLRLFGDRTSFGESRLSLDELRTLVQEASTTGTIPPKAGEIASRALDLPGLRVEAVMTPRHAIRAIDASQPAEKIREAVLAIRHERLPVCEGSLDEVRGYVLARDVLLNLLEGKPAPLEGAVREAPFFPETAEAVTVLEELRQRQALMAFVVDEQGALTGLVTLEDFVEEVVGDIFSERETRTEPVRAEAPGVWLAEGRTAIRELNRTLELGLPEDPAYSTIAGLVLHRLGRIPRIGQELVVEDAGVKVEVLESSTRRVGKVRLTRLG